MISVPSDEDAVGMTTGLTCSECERAADGEVRGWQAHLVDLDEDGDDEIAFFCPSCATREFGSQRRAR